MVGWGWVVGSKVFDAGVLRGQPGVMLVVVSSEVASGRVVSSGVVLRVKVLSTGKRHDSGWQDVPNSSFLYNLTTRRASTTTCLSPTCHLPNRRSALPPLAISLLTTCSPSQQRHPGTRRRRSRRAPHVHHCGARQNRHHYHSYSHVHGRLHSCFLPLDNPQSQLQYPPPRPSPHLPPSLWWYPPSPHPTR